MSSMNLTRRAFVSKAALALSSVFACGVPAIAFATEQATLFPENYGLN